MRILVLIPDAFGGRGGIAKFNQDFLNALCTYPHTTEVVAIPRHIVDFVDLLPNKLTYVNSASKGKISFVKGVWQAIKRNPKFDFIICGHINFLPLAYLLKIWLQSPIFLTLYGIEAWQPSSNLLVNNLLNKVEGIISISEFTKKRFLDWAKLDVQKEFILPCTVNLNNFQVGVKNIDLLKRYQLQSKTVIMTLGRLHPAERYKGFDEVLEILPAIIKEIPNIVYMIVGEGQDRQRLEEKAKSLGIEKRVVFTGFISDAEKADHYRLADAYVMPSKGEGFGIVYLEAIACGIPVIGSSVDGGREALRNGLLGILVNPYNLEEIKAGILEALKRPIGTVPEDLNYFCDDNFQRRCHSILDQVIK